MVVDVVANGHDELFEILEDAAPQLVFGQVAEEAFHHIEPTGRGRGEVHMEALMAGEPADDFLVLVRGVVIADQIDMLLLGDGLVDQAEKLQPLLVPVALLAEAEDLAVERVEGGKQGGRAIAFIVVRHRLPPPYLQGQSGLGSVQGLYLALLIEVSRDPEFAGKLEAIVGLYLNPPEHALVLKV